MSLCCGQCHVMNCLGQQVLESPIFSSYKGLSLSLLLSHECTLHVQQGGAQSLAVWK